MDAQEGYPARRVTFQRQKFVKRLEGFGFEKKDEGLFSESYNVLRLDQIWRFQDSLHQRNEEAERELFQRLKDVYVTPWRANADSGRKVDTIDGYALYDAASDEGKVRCLAVAVDRLRETKSRVVSAGDDNYYYNKRRTRYMVEFHRKFTLSIACLLFFLIGAPLGAIVRKGGLGFPMGISVLFFVLYYVISTTTEKFAKQLVWDDVTGMWFSTFVLVPMAVFLIFKAKNDSPLFRREWYGARIRRLGTALRFKSKGNSDSRK
jgi:predicted permeases